MLGRVFGAFETLVLLAMALGSLVAPVLVLETVTSDPTSAEAAGNIVAARLPRPVIS